MQGMFYNCTLLTSLDVSNFDTSNVTNMKDMFYNCNKLNIIRLNNINDNQLLKILDKLPINTTTNAIMFTDKNISNAIKIMAISKNWTPISYDFDEDYNIFIVKCDGNDEIGLSINRRGDITEYDGLTDWGDGAINDELYHTYM